MQLDSLLKYPNRYLLIISFKEFAILFDSALSHLNQQKDLLSREKDHDVIKHYRRAIAKLEGILVTLRMHQHYQSYQNEVSSFNTYLNKAA